MTFRRSYQGIVAARLQEGEVVMEEPDGDIADAEALDPASLGFMCGLEIHQQLATGKLHSRQSGELHDVTIDTLPPAWPQVKRRLRAASGEGGRVDVAARFEQQRNRSFIYAQSPNSGLIELDESPPRDHDSDAVDISLTIASMLDMKPISLMQAMRKTVVDGSNTSGFQRTTLIATDGILVVEGGDVGIDVLCLEEDSARRLDTISSDDGEVVIWNLDRLGIPLVELATAPDVRDPVHAKATAKAIGTLLRDTRRVRRGLGSIRQDLNVSIAAGDRVEIKGCQDLDWIPRIISLEMARQLHFYRLANELRTSLNLPALPADRRITDRDTEDKVRKVVRKKLVLRCDDITTIFQDSASKMVRDSLARETVMLALPLPGMAGRLGKKGQDEQGAQLPRLGRELAGAAKTAGVKGIFHSDELPAYGITKQEVATVRKKLALAEDVAFVLCIAPRQQAELALEAVLTRARLAWHRIPQEVRNVVVRKGLPEDGTTVPMRPLPGGARMYPETDVATFRLDAARWDSLSSNLPLRQQQRIERLALTDLSEDQSKQILAKELDDVLIGGIEGGLGFPAVQGKSFASLLLAEMAKVPAGLVAAMVHLRERGVLARDAELILAEDILTAVAWSEEMSVEECRGFLDMAAQRAQQLGLEPVDAGALREVIETLVLERLDFVKERGLGAIGPLMGVVMLKAKGADGKEVSAILRDVIQDNI